MKITCIDFETANQSRASACSVGIASIVDGLVVETREWKLRPKKGYGFFIPEFTEIHGLNWFDVKDAQEFDAIYPELHPYFDDALLVAHKADFDMSVLRSLLELYGLPKPPCHYLCTLALSRKAFPGISHSLDILCEQIGHPFEHHKAGSDAEAAAQLLLAMMKRYDLATPEALAGRLEVGVSDL